MNIQHFLITILGGLGGTICMTAVMYLYQAAFKTDTRVIHIFGTMVTGVSDYSLNDRKTLIAGSAGHLAAGMGFALSYFLLWNWGVFSVKFWDSVILGAISGVVAIGIWRCFFSLHHHPPKIAWIHYSLALFIAHIVFAIVTVFTFTLVYDDPQFWYELRK